MEKKPLNLILLGDPASGKGTQAARLAKKYHFYDLDIGKEVLKPRVRVQYDYKRTTAIGKLTPTPVVRNIFRHVIRTVPQARGILFNGNPKMIGEARLVSKLLAAHKRAEPLVIYLSIPLKETVKRASLRRRDDDSVRALRNRQRYYKEQVAHVVSFFKQHYTVKNISGMGSEAEIWKRIDAAVRNHVK